jgi:hypothetical protein
MCRLSVRLIEKRDQFIASRTDTAMHEGEIEGSRGFKSPCTFWAVVTVGLLEQQFS